MSKDIYVKAHYRARGTRHPKWIAYHHASGHFLQGVKGRIFKDRHPPTRLQFRNTLKKYLKEYDGEDWGDGWTLLAVR